MKLLFEDHPISELQKRLGLAPRQIYNHVIWCNAPKHMIPGTYGVSCNCSIVDSRDNLISDLGKSDSAGAIEWRKRNT